MRTTEDGAAGSINASCTLDAALTLALTVRHPIQPLESTSIFSSIKHCSDAIDAVSWSACSGAVSARDAATWSPLVGLDVSITGRLLLGSACQPQMRR